MPCYEGREGDVEERLMRDCAPALLCGICTSLKEISILQQILNQVDWREVGLTEKDFWVWWKRHQLEDMRRKKRGK